jgi:hypothetical protein
VVGGATPAEVGQIGGVATLNSDGAHSHGGTTGALSYREGEVNWPRQKGRNNPFSHVHSITIDGGHNHGGENRPPFFTVFFLCKYAG